MGSKPEPIAFTIVSVLLMSLESLVVGWWETALEDPASKFANVEDDEDENFGFDESNE